MRSWIFKIFNLESDDPETELPEFDVQEQEDEIRANLISDGHSEEEILVMDDQFENNPSELWQEFEALLGSSLAEMNDGKEPTSNHE